MARILESELARLTRKVRARATALAPAETAGSTATPAPPDRLRRWLATTGRWLSELLRRGRGRA